MTALLKEKEEQIAGLMEEGEPSVPLWQGYRYTLFPYSLPPLSSHTGEKLSKKELQNSNVIKKLKEKNKQNDQLLTAQRYNHVLTLWTQYTCIVYWMYVLDTVLISVV